MKRLTIFMSAGEVSGDVVGAGLACVLRRYRPGALMYGLGGSRMAAAGVRVEFETNHLGSVGLSEPIFAIPALIGALRKIRKMIQRERPDVAILIGNDVFNVLLARWLKAKKIHTVSYFPPQIWLWRSLARVIARCFDSILTCFPEEQSVYQRAGGTATFVGHYLCDLLTPVTAESRMQAREQCGLGRDGPVVGLLPGSRAYEVNSLTPVLLDAALELAAADRSLRFILPLAEPCFEKAITAQIRRRGLSSRITITKDSHTAMTACDLALVASGTATLEAALLTLPMIILYRVSPITLAVVRLLRLCRLIDSETVGLPNLLLRRMVAPELRQTRATAPELARLAGSILRDEQRRERMRQDLRLVAEHLGGKGSQERAAQVVLSRAAGPRSESGKGKTALQAPAAVSRLSERV